MDHGSFTNAIFVYPDSYDKNFLGMDTCDSSTPNNDQSIKCSYQSPIFTDQHRLEKIKNVLPTLQNYFQNVFGENHFPGLAYGLVVDGQLFHSHCFGYTNLEQQIPVNTKSLFRIASMTKSFTAMAIVKLRDDDQLRLDDPIDQYIPELKVTDLLTKDAPILTIQHLLTQDAGMPEDDPWADRQLAISDDDFLSMLKKGVTLSNPPGSVWEYTNLAYAMLGRIITVVSQVPYQEYITREILVPLGMTNTVWEYSEAPLDLLAQGYRWQSDRYLREDLLHDGTYGAMGGLMSSIEDFSKYISYHLQAWPARDEAEYGPIRRSSLREMHHPRNFIELGKSANNPNLFLTGAYCYGLIWSKTSDGRITVDHTGGLPGFGSNWLILPEYGIGLVSFANNTYAGLHNTNATIMGQLITEADLKPRQLPVSNHLSERKQQLIKLVLEEHWNFDESHKPVIFAENFFLDESLERRRSSSKELLKEAGEILVIGEVIPKNQLRGHFDIQGAHNTIRIAFSLSPENPPLIQELALSKMTTSS